MVQIFEETEPDRMVWLAHDGHVGSGHWRGMRNGRAAHIHPNVLRTTEDRISEIERHVAGADVRWMDVQENEL